MKNIQRKQSLTSGRTDPNGITTLYADQPGGMRKMRCPGCNNMIPPTTDQGGKTIYACGACGSRYVSKPL